MYDIQDYRIRRWNRTAADCYMRGCICQGCPIYELYFKDKHYKCQMKVAVIAMVRKFGVPDSLKNWSKGIIKD